MRLRNGLRLLLALALLVLPACGEKEPIRLGFVAGLSGRVADLGVAGRNGVQLAVEQRNAAGGIDGRPIRLVVRDDRQDPQVARQAVGDLLKQQIELIIGPMTSSMAMAVLPQVNASNSLLLSPTATTTELLGRDDQFLRVISTTRDYGGKSARYQFDRLGVRTVAALYDERNRSYCVSWLDEFQREFQKKGGRMLARYSFRSGSDIQFLPLAQQLLQTGADAVIIVGNAVDAALFCQQLRKLAPQQRILMAEWASTERFIELAGAAAEGVVVAQFLDRNDPSTRYRKFLQDYRQRFKQEPGFAGLAGYDAGLVAIAAYAGRRSGETLKQSILRQQQFQGAQQLLRIDRFGDSDRKTYVTEIRNRKYVTLE